MISYLTPITYRQINCKVTSCSHLLKSLPRKISFENSSNRSINFRSKTFAQKNPSHFRKNRAWVARRHATRRVREACLKPPQTILGKCESIGVRRELLAEDPAEVVCWLNVGAAYVARREWDKAREVCVPNVVVLMPKDLCFIDIV